MEYQRGETREEGVDEGVKQAGKEGTTTLSSGRFPSFQVTLLLFPSDYIEARIHSSHYTDPSSSSPLPRFQVIILSAALDLVSTSTPKGVVAFFNIFPALVAKVGWPYILKGRVRYRRRVASCALLSFIGMLVSSSVKRAGESSVELLLRLNLQLYKD